MILEIGYQSWFHDGVAQALFALAPVVNVALSAWVDVMLQIAMRVQAAPRASCVAGPSKVALEAHPATAAQTRFQSVFSSLSVIGIESID